MNESVAKKTQETLGKVIKKPPLTEKLLSKPPFRYLHDIFSEVIRTTGFMKGLYGEAEMKADNVKDKDSKIAFLQKAIDVVMLVSGEPLAAKPARIVAGHEPEKTNELLQVIAKCCLNKLSSDEAVRRVLAGDKLDQKGKPSTSRSQDKENREGRERHQDREERKGIKESSGSREQKDPDQPKDQESKRDDKDRRRDAERSDKGRERDRTKDRDRDKDKEKSRDREKDKTREKEREKEKDRNRDKERERDKERDKKREREPHKDRDRGRERDKERDREREKRREREKDKERHRETDEKPKDRGDRKIKAAEEISKPKPPPEVVSKTHEAEADEVRLISLTASVYSLYVCSVGMVHHQGLLSVDVMFLIVYCSCLCSSELEAEGGELEPTDLSEIQAESPSRIPRPSSAKGQRRWPKTGGQDETESEGEGEAPSAEKPVHIENGDTVNSVPPQTTHRRLPRPSSARPAAPRVKRQESYADVTPAERLGSGKTPATVILDGKKLSEDEDDEDGQFVVEEAAAPPPDIPEIERNSLDLQGNDKHGGLVKKILETKKDYESSPATKSKEQDRSLVSEVSRKKERELVAKEIERLRSSIQTVCRSALPLGKIMDYIQEDMDSMQNELQTWHKENKENAQALLQEQRITDSVVEPLKAELAELEQLIKDQQDKICAVKSSILKNEEKIQKMVSSISFSSQT
uniref:TRAF3-interacting protein 1 n=1 Tax=Cyprinus carpio carpio TaxID=630221 RepID=A0A9J8C0T0_CYPCA